MGRSEKSTRTRAKRKQTSPAWWIVHLACVLALWLVAPALSRLTTLGGLLSYPPPLVYMVTSLAVCGTAFLFKARFRWAHVGCAVVCVFLVGGFQIRLPRKGDPDLRVLSLNVLGGEADVKDVAAYIKRNDIDVALFQESETPGGDFGQLVARELGGCQTLSRKETSIVSRIGMKDEHVIELDVVWGRAVLGATVGRQRPIRVMCVHWPIPQFGLKPAGLRQRLRRGSQVRRPVIDATVTMAKESRIPTVIGGDFNTPPLEGAYASLDGFLENTFGAVGNGFGYTYRADIPVTRIDHFWTKGDVEPLTCAVGPSFGSDHRSLVATYKLR